MSGITMQVKGDTLTITVPLNGTRKLSSTGKTATVASTHGNQAVALPSGEVVKVGVNVFGDASTVPAAK